VFRVYVCASKAKKTFEEIKTFQPEGRKTTGEGPKSTDEGSNGGKQADEGEKRGQSQAKAGKSNKPGAQQQQQQQQQQADQTGQALTAKGGAKGVKTTIAKATRIKNAYHDIKSKCSILLNEMETNPAWAWAKETTDTNALQQAVCNLEK